jgi:hypothetical protein
MLSELRPGRLFARRVAQRASSRQIFTYAGSGHNSFFGIVADTQFSSISLTATGDGDRWRLDNVSIARQGVSRATR